MFGIGGFELFLILIFGFLIFGPDKLPTMARTLGRAIAKFRTAQEDMTEQLKKQTFIDKDSDEPFKNPLDVIEHAAKDTKEGAQSARAAADKVTEKVTSKVAEHTERTESFAERKARYDRERAERKAAEVAREKAEAEEQGAHEKEDPIAAVSAKGALEATDVNHEEA